MTADWFEERLPGIETIENRLALSIPGALDPRGWARREIAAKTVFVMLYGLAIEGEDRWIRPTAVADMTDEQAQILDPRSRIEWLDRVQSRNRPREVPGRWYGENTRESIRDETLNTLVDLDVVKVRRGLPTTSPKPRYALARSYVDLLDPELLRPRLSRVIQAWQEENLSPTALARQVLLRKQVSAATERVLIRLPNGETRVFAPGPSSDLTRHVVEGFAPRFLVEPAVVMISESATKLAFRDDSICRAIGFEIEVSGTLPDAILADVASGGTFLVIVECVVTDGPITERRRSELLQLADEAGFESSDVALLTVFSDRAESPYRRMAASLAWESFVWFASEPEQIIALHGEESSRFGFRKFTDAEAPPEGS